MFDPLTAGITSITSEPTIYQLDYLSISQRPSPDHSEDIELI